MELVMGCKNQADLQQIQKFLSSFSVAWPDASEFAMEWSPKSVDRYLSMVKTLSLKTEIPENREVHITLPNDVPVGPAELVLVVSTPAYSGDSTLGALARSEFFGVWKDRSDITDSFAQTLRSEGWKRRVDGLR